MSENLLYGSFPVEFIDADRALEVNTSVSNEFVASFLERRLPEKCRDEQESNGRFYSLGFLKRRGKNSGKTRTKQLDRRRKLSAKEKKLLKKSNSKDEKSTKYETYIPLRELWLEYFRHSILTPDAKPTEKLGYVSLYVPLLKCDYHGCIVSVTKSKCPSLVGTTGIILQETRNTFKIVTKDDKIKVVAKMNSVFTFEVDGVTFTIYGNQFRVKPSERSVRKFKAKATIAL